MPRKSSFPDPVFVLPSCPWAQDATLARVYGVLNDGAVDAPLTLLVGGCVRNAVMGRKIADHDLASVLAPDEIMARVRSAGMQAVPTGIDHGTVTVVDQGRGFEVTRLRVDVVTDGRHAVVLGTDDWAADSARRDFTMNALYADLAGRIYAWIPDALADAQAGRVQFVGDPSARVAEDYLRILRFFRFYAHYGRGDMDADGLAACHVAASHLESLSRERITAEMLKWLGAEDPVYAVQRAYDNNVLSYVLHAVLDVAGLERLVARDRSIGSVNPLLRALVLCGGDAGSVQSSFRLSNTQARYLEEVARLDLETPVTEFSLRRDLARGRRDVVLSRFLMDLAVRGGPVPDYFRNLAVWIVPVFPVTGDDLISAGIPPGPELGVLLRSIRARWIAGNFQAPREDILTWAFAERPPK